MITILNSKLLAPNISETITRERLRDLLEEIPLRKLTTVIAGAGYGKTTLVAQAVRTYRWKTVWYRLDESDRDLVTFVSYLVAGIGKLSADFGQDTLQRIKGIEDPKAECDEILAVLISEIEKAISQDLFLVLEDFHLIQESRETNRALDFLLKNLPPNLHLIIVGRLEPELSLSRLRSTREILEIKTEDLTFTDIETDRFCRKLLGSSLKDESLKTLKRKTEGWVTGLILFYHDSKGRDQSEIEKRITDLKGSSEVISSYLYENTFENLPETSRDFLLKTSILPRLEVDFCNQYLKIDKSRDILYQLTKSQLFTSSLDDAGENFCYHHLFQEFLTKRLKDTSGQKTVRNLHAEAAELCEKLGKTEEALDHLIAAEAFAGACNLAEDALTVWMEEGRIQMIYSFLNKMPQQFLEKQSWYATIRPFLTGKFRDAIEEWQKIYRNLDKQNSIEEAHQALLAIAGSHLLLGEFVQAESKIKSLLEQKGLSESVRMQILKILIQTASSQGRIEEADRYYADLTLLLEKLDKPRDWKEAVLSSLQCFKYSNVGDLTNSLLHGEHAIKLGLKGELQIEIVYCYLTVSMSHCFLGDYAEGFRKAEQGLQLLEETGFQDESLSTQFLAFLAANTLGLGEIDAAIAYAERSIRTASGNNLGYRALGYFFLAVAHKLAGNLPLVEENLAKALRSAPKTNWWRTIIEFQSLHHTIELGKYTDIRKFFDEAASNPEKWRSQKPSILMLQAHYYSEIGKHSSAMKMFLESLVISEKTQSGPGVFGVSPWAVPLLVETYAKGKMKPYLQKHMKSVMGPWINDKEFKSISNSRDPKIRKALADMVSYLPKTPPGDLTVNFFGKFEVSAGNEPMPDKRWKSRKAKTLFTFLAFKRSQGYTPKEVLMELLWPEDDPKKTLKRFHVLLATLRKILEPDILSGVASSYIVREGDGYRLSLGEKGATDFEEFMGLLEKGRQETDPEIVLRCFEKAESIYKGDFLEEDPYVDWCDQQRERFRNEYLSLLSWIMDDYEGKKSYDSCIAYAEKHLSVDPYAEDVYRRLMIYHLHNDSQKRAKEVYERCRKHLAEGLDCSVSPETESLYRQIVMPAGGHNDA